MGDGTKGLVNQRPETIAAGLRERAEHEKMEAVAAKLYWFIRQEIPEGADDGGLWSLPLRRAKPITYSAVDFAKELPGFFQGSGAVGGVQKMCRLRSTSRQVGWWASSTRAVLGCTGNVASRPTCSSQVPMAPNQAWSRAG